MNSSLTFIDGLEFPSMRRDSVESVNSDDFTQGLNFNSITPVSHHSSMDSLVAEHDAAIHSQNDRTLQPQIDEQVHFRNEPVHRYAQDNPPQSRDESEIRRRTNQQSRSFELTTGSSEGYEVIDRSEVQDVLEKEIEHQTQDDSYISSGTAYMGKLFGYS